MPSVINEALATQWLDLLRAQTCYASLHFEIPSLDNPLASEVDGPSYVRSELTWEYGSARALRNIQLLSWMNLSLVTIEAIGVWDETTNGDLLVTAVLDDPITIPNLGSWELSPGLLWVAV